MQACAPVWAQCTLGVRAGIYNATMLQMDAATQPTASREHSAITRRVQTIARTLALAAGLLVVGPVLVAIALLVDAVRRDRRLMTVRMLAFAAVYLAVEVWGLSSLLTIWLTRSAGARDAATEVVQTRFARALLWGVKRAFRLRFTVRVPADDAQTPLLVFVRHASIIDTLLPSVFLAAPGARSLRFVLKRELQSDPCIDIAGGWLRNHFVSRGSQESAREIDAVGQLVADLLPREGCVIFPEGTRFSAAKRAPAIAQLAARDPALATRAERWLHVLPPRMGGPLAMLTHAPRADVLFVAHRGLEGAGTVFDIWRGAAFDREVVVEAWRVARADVPADTAGRVRFLFDAWERINALAEPAAMLQGVSAPQRVPPPAAHGAIA